MSPLTHKRIIAAAAVPAVAAATLTGAVSPASAATMPRAYTTGSAGYGMSHAQFGSVQFRYVKASVYLRPPARFAAIDDEVSWQTELSGIGASGQPVQVSLIIGGDPQTQGGYHASAHVNGGTLTGVGSTAFPPGHSVTESIYYNRASGMITVRASDGSGVSYVAFAPVGTVSFGQASVYGGFDPGASFTAPAAPVKLGSFSGFTVTTGSGHRGTIARWYAHHKVFATSDGTASGVLRAEPTDLSAGGSAFSVFFEPAR